MRPERYKLVLGSRSDDIIKKDHRRYEIVDYIFAYFFKLLLTVIVMYEYIIALIRTVLF